MRADTAAFRVKNVDVAKRPRYVVEVAFDIDNLTLWYFTSHSDSALPEGTSSILGVLEGMSGTSQTLSPDTANASIGSISFNLVDKASIVTTTLGSQLTLGRSTRRQRVRVYVGFEGMAWTDYTLIQTQLITQIEYVEGIYTFTCADIQREMRKDIFDLARTTLSQTLSASAGTVEVVSTAGFARLAHGNSYSDAPNSLVGYLKIQDEVIRYTGLTATQFTGCSRGALNTLPVEHAIDPNVAVDRRTVVEEFVYLEMPAVKTIYALLTGGFPDAPANQALTKDYDSSLWVAGQTPTGYTLNQNTSGESTFATRVGPDGYNEVVNVCQSLDSFAGEPGTDGGWNMNQAISFDRTKSHLYACWFKRLSTGTLGSNASTYWGLATDAAAQVLWLDGTNNTNPYFNSGATASILPTADKWYLAIGFVHENGYGTTDTNISGIYDPSTGIRVVAGLEFKWDATATTLRHRAYHYYNEAISGEIQQMARPRVFECTVANADAMIRSLLMIAHRVPTSWHLGISPSYVRHSDFMDKHDIYDWRDDRKGFITRFEGLDKSDGKKFIESELSLLLGSFMPIYADGALGFRRMSNILAGAPYVKLLDDKNLVKANRVLHDFNSLRNIIQVNWNWEVAREDFTRVNLLIDSTSVDVHGQADPLKLRFRGLHGSRHSSAMLSQRFDAIRDRFTSPPLRTRVTALPSLNDLEVGDVIRLKPTAVRDFVSSGPLDRSFEIQNVSVDWITGDVEFDLFGSSAAPSSEAPTSDPVVLTDAWYSSEGTDLTSVLTITGSNPGHVTANGSLTGNANMLASGAIYYYNGDLVIDPDVNVNIANNVQLRIRGFLQNNGTINGKGTGLTGAAAVSPATSQTHHNPGVVGFIGTPIAGGGMIFQISLTKAQLTSFEGARTTGLNVAIPSFNLIWDGTTLIGLPGDLRGSSGSSGMPVNIIPHATPFTAGGAGGDSGAGLIIVTRGFAQGVAGKIDLSGDDGSVGSVIGAFYAGSGAGGAPGGLLIVLDGALTTATGLTESGFVANYGESPIPAPPAQPSELLFDGDNDLRYSFFVGNGDGTTFPLPTLSGSRGALRVQYVPGNVAATPDLSEATLPAPTNFGLAAGAAELLVNRDGTITSRIRATWTAALDSRVLAYDLQFKPSSESIWVSAPTVFGQAETATFFPVTRDGVNWDARIRSAGADRKTSAWVTITAFMVAGKTATPANVGVLSFTDPVLSWADVIDLDRSGYIVRYHPGSNTDWASAIPAHEQGYITETRFDTGHLVGGQTTLLVKARDTTGNVSATASTLLVDLRPATVTSFGITRQPDGTREFAWSTTVLPTDFDGAKIRYFLGTTSDWAAMTDLHSGILKASPFETNQLAAGTYTFAVKNIDKAGNESANATFITTVTIGDPRIVGAVEDIKEEPNWTGTKTDCHVDTATGWLVADGNSTWTTLPATWTAWTQWNASPKSPITYVILIDIGVKVKFVPLVTVVVDGTPVIEEQHSDDNISYSSYAVVGPQLDARYIRIRVTVTGSYPKIRSMRTILSATPISEIIEDLDTASLTGSYDLGVGDIRLPITKIYSIIKKVDVSLQNVGAGWSWELMDKNTAIGPRIRIYNSSNTLADAVIDATITGL